MGSSRGPAAERETVRQRVRRWLSGAPAAVPPPVPLRELVDQLFRSFPGVIVLQDAASVEVRRGGRGGDPSAAAWQTHELPIADAAGQRLGTLRMSTDRSELAAALERARTAEAERDLLRTVLNCIPDQIYAKDGTHRFRVANAEVARRITGTPDPALVLGRTDHDFFPRADADRYRRDEAKLMSAGDNLVELEEQAVYRGRPCWNHTTKVVLREGARVVGLVGINRDVTARKEAEEALAAERTLLHALMDNIPDCIYFKDTEGRFVRANRAQAAFLGVDDPEILAARRLSSFLTGRGALEVESAERELLKDGRPQVGRMEQMGRADGGAAWFLTTRMPLRDTAGRVTGLVAICRDVTERREAEDRLEAALSAFLDFAHGVAEGDLTGRAPEGADTVGRIGAAVNRMLERIGAILAEVQGTVAHVALSADEILRASRYIAEGAERQSGEVLATSASVEELAASMNAVSRDALAWAGSSKDALAQVGVGDSSVARTTEAMNRIFESVDQTAGRMRLLARRAAEISSIIDLIDDIASQSTLLSLNAAIQAAHAGEAGKGFAVVADEIRRLAERSTQATRDVAEIIETIQADTAEALASTEGGLQEVRLGRDLADQASGALRRIQSAVGQTSKLSVLISEASSEQAQITRQLAGTMENFASISQSSSASAHQSAQTVQSLVELSRQLERGVGRFRIAGSGR